MSLLTLASLALSAGPSLIRGVSSLFGGSSTVETVAKTVEAVNREFTSPQDKVNAIEHVLDQMTPEQKIELQQLQVALEKEITARHKIAADDNAAAHSTTQATIQAADKSGSWLVRATRPLMALISTCAGSWYVITNESPDLTVASVLFALGATYMGLRHREKDRGLSS